MSDPYDYTPDFDNLSFRIRQEFMIGMSSPRRFVKLDTDGLPAPLREAADRMNDAKSDAEAKAAAHELLLLSEEWL